MSELKAWGLVLIDGKAVAPIFQYGEPISTVKCESELGNDIVPVNVSRPQRCYTVAILPDGRAKEIGDPEPQPITDGQGISTFGERIRNWQASESKLLTLPCKYNPTPHTVEASNAINKVNAKWYATLSDNTFTPAKPVRE